MAGIMPSWNEDVALEIEALEATYGEDLTTDDTSVSMLLRPLADEPSDAYVQCEVRLGVPGTSYPSESPSIQLQDAKGLGSCRFAALEARLREEAALMLGEMVLGQLFESAKDWLTQHNWPEGPCIFCLEELHTSSSSSSSSHSHISQQVIGDLQQQQQYMSLPCFHAFHKSCFVNWWVWQQQSLLQQQQQLQQKTGTTAAAAIIQEQLPPREGDHFQLSCPTCRQPFSIQHDLERMKQQLTTQLQQQQQQQCVQASSIPNSSSSSSGQDSSMRLSEDQLAPFKEIQKQHAALFAAQQQRDGIIQENSYSITDWDSTAAAGAAAAAAAVPVNNVAQQKFGSKVSQQRDSRSSSGKTRQAKCSAAVSRPAAAAAAEIGTAASSSSSVSSCNQLRNGMANGGRGRRGSHHHLQQQQQQRGCGQQQWRGQSRQYPGRCDNTQQQQQQQQPTGSIQQQPQQQQQHCSIQLQKQQQREVAQQQRQDQPRRCPGPSSSTEQPGG